MRTMTTLAAGALVYYLAVNYGTRVLKVIQDPAVRKVVRLSYDTTKESN
jgi:hypothetical protein